MQTHTQFVQQLKLRFQASSESQSKIDKSNRCKNKDVDVRERKAPALSRSSARPPSIPTCAPFLAAWRAGYSENIEWKAFSTQSVSHPGKGDLGGGEAARLQALIPGCYDRASGWEIWRSSSTGLFPLSWHPLGCISHISNTCCIHTVSKKVRVLFSQIIYTLVIKKPTLCVRLAMFLKDRFFVLSTWSGLPVLGPRRWASLWMCSGSPAPTSKSPSLCLVAGVGSLWTQTAACNSGGAETGKEKRDFKEWYSSVSQTAVPRPLVVCRRPLVVCKAQQGSDQLFYSDVRHYSKLTKGLCLK